MGKVIVVASGKGGTGKTTTVAVLSSCLAELGYKTLCLDCDVGMRNLDLLLGMSDYSVRSFADVLSGSVPAEDAPVRHPKIPKLFFLSAPAAVKPEDVDREAFAEMVGELAESFDYCLIDAPAGVGPGFYLAAAAAQEAIIVSTDDLPSLRDGQRAAELLRQMGIEELRLIVNRVRLRHLRRLKTTVDDAIDSVSVQLLGVVYEDQNVLLATNMEQPLILWNGSRQKAIRQFRKIAGRIAGQEIAIDK